eukprot:4059632-Prymnesium_polylepis.1
MGAGRFPHISGKNSLRSTEAGCSENCGKISDRATPRLPWRALLLCAPPAMLSPFLSACVSPCSLTRSSADCGELPSTDLDLCLQFGWSASSSASAL